MSVQCRPWPQVEEAWASSRHDNKYFRGHIFIKSDFSLVVLREITSARGTSAESLWYLQDNMQNQLIQFELLLNTATFVVAIFVVVAGIFGMDFEIDFFEQPGAFKWVLTITGIYFSTVKCKVSEPKEHRAAQTLLNYVSIDMK
ncbi:hypothetical protein YC2023_076303 [Brassica napus]